MHRISLVTGDGIGPELADATELVLDKARSALHVDIGIERVQAGDAALASCGNAMPEATLEAIRSSDACLKAPVGESARDVIVFLRSELDLYANIRPARSYPGMPALREDIDLVIVRENTEDVYTGGEVDLGGGAGVALRTVSDGASERIARCAFEEARARAKKRRVTCVHKANVMRITDGIFSRACARVASEYEDIEFDEMYVDACAMNLIREPQKFDVIVTTNMFGDILSDESAQAVGGLGMAPAANIGESAAIFEPVHGAAFDIAGTQSANPSSFILSACMMLEWLGRTRDDPHCTRAASGLSDAVYGTVASGAKTRDIGGTLSTLEFAQEVASRLS